MVENLEHTQEKIAALQALPNSVGLAALTPFSTTSLTIRPYQAEALEAVHQAIVNNISRPLIDLPTGTGKTIIFAQLIRNRGGRTLVLAHRDELIEQAVEKILLVDPSADIGVVKGKRNEKDARIVVASIQTLSKKKRLSQLPKDFRTLIVDEAHHAVAKSYRRVLRYLRAFERENPPLTVGLTATPTRGDGVGLKPIFQKIVYSRTILEMIEQQYLIDLRSRRIELPVDFNQFRVQRGDFIDGEVSRLLVEANAPQYIVSAVKEQASERKVIVFVPGVELAMEVAACFQSNGIASEAVHGKMNLIERRAVLARLRAGDTRVAVNCMVLTEGFDESSVDCIVIARPTKRRSLYIQMIGRGTRLHPGKHDCLKCYA
jgi:superfamily II DNA or RNA helicase